MDILNDVKIPDADWVALRDKALFFVPAVITLKNERSVSNRDIADRARDIGITLSGAIVGQSLRLEPVSHEKASDIVRTIQSIYSEDGYRPLSSGSIICSVFFLERNPLRGAEGEAVAENCRRLGLSQRAIDVASGGFRIPLSVALRVLEAENSGERPSIEQMSNDIGTRASYSIKTAYRLKGEPPLLWSDLRPAPKDGHPWRLTLTSQSGAA